MKDYTFETPEPVGLFVEIASGQIEVVASDVATTLVQVDGASADDVTVTQRGREIAVVAPKRSMFGKGHGLQVTMQVPTGSDLVTKTGSADLSADGTFGQAQLQSGSGEVRLGTFTGEVVVTTGSGAIAVEDAQGDVRIKSGSGEVEVGSCGGTCAVSTGSGDISIGTAAGGTALKTGSGDVSIKSAGPDTSMVTGSGDLDIQSLAAGKLQAKASSGDVGVGVPAGIPVWTDISTLSGDVRSDVAGAGQPAEGEPFVELRVHTTSGDIHIFQS